MSVLQNECSPLLLRSLNENHLLERGLTNYWGYNTIGFFAADPRYFANGSVDEFKQLVDRFHTADVGVILDVVYNHTAEGNELGPTLSFRGINNVSCYYRLVGDQKRYYHNHSGTGNTLNLSVPHVLQMVTDSLRYWVTEMTVDGFRFEPQICSRPADQPCPATALSLLLVSFATWPALPCKVA